MVHSKDAETLPAPARAPTDGAAPAFSDGSLIDGKYLVERTLASGGIGVVVVATHLALNQRVAIKYLKTHARTNPIIVERFVREARLVAQLRSDHVVRVHDVGSLEDAGPYMVMEYLQGTDLGGFADAGQVPIASAVNYALQVCDALADAHRLRIVHRDIKPENLFLAERSEDTPIIKLIDFGISKMAPRRGEDGAWAHLTAATDRFGTPVYMSPEQLRSSSDVDGRTDIWSLGVVLFELLTGELPFEAGSLPQLCTSILTAPPTPLTQLRKGAPKELEAVILKCLEKDPDRRFRNIAELAQDLLPFAPADSHGSVERIKQRIRHGGASIRPPTPFPGSLHLSPLVDIVPPRLDTGPVPPVALGVPQARARWGAAFFGIAFASFSIGFLMILLWRSAHPSPAVRAATAANIVAEDVARAPQPAIDVSAPVSLDAVADAAPAAKPLAARAPRRAVIAPASPPPRGPSLRSQFGDRR